MKSYRVGERSTTDRQLASAWAKLWGLHVRVVGERAHEQWHWNGHAWEAVPAPVLWAPDAAWSGRRRVEAAWASRLALGVVL